MGQRDLDKYFKDNLKGFSKEVDTDAIFSALDLPEKKKDRSFLLWIVGFFLLVIIATSYFALDKFTDNQKALVLQKENIKLQPKSNKTATTNIDQTETEPLNNLSADQYRKSLIEKNQTNLTKQKNTLAKKNTTTQTALAIQSPTKTFNQSNTKLTNTESISINTNNVLNLENSEQKSKLAALMSGREKQSTKQADEALVKLNEKNIPLLLSMASIKTNLPALFETAERKKYELDLIAEPQLSKKLHKGLSLNIYSGIYKVKRSLNSFNSDFDQFLSQKDSTETPLELISVGTALKYSFGSFYAKAGVEFQSLNEKFIYEEYEVLDTVSVPGVVSYIIDPSGNSTEQLGTVQEENILIRKWTYFNNYRLLTIPLSLGYEKKLNNKWFVSAEAQTILNFKRNFSGKQLDMNGNLTDVAFNLDKSFKMGYGLSVGLRYSLSNSTSVYLNPHYFWYNDSYSNEQGKYSQKYEMYGLQLGLNYNLF